MDIDEPDRVDENLGMFEAAVHAKHVSLPDAALRSIAVVLDGSNQDETVRGFAAVLARRTGAKVHERTGGEAAEILRFGADCAADLIVIDVPFGSDIGVLKDESLGAVVDMLLLESTRPVLCVRDLMDADAIEQALNHAIWPVSTHLAPYADSGSWALRLAGSGGSVYVLATADSDALQEAHQLLGGRTPADVWTPEALSRAFTDDLGGLISAVQQRGAELKIHVRVQIGYGRSAELVLEEANRQPQLIVAASIRDHRAPSYHLASDLILGAKGPVMVVSCSEEK